MLAPIEPRYMNRISLVEFPFLLERATFLMLMKQFSYNTKWSMR